LQALVRNLAGAAIALSSRFSLLLCKPAAFLFFPPARSQSSLMRPIHYCHDGLFPRGDVVLITSPYLVPPFLPSLIRTVSQASPTLFCLLSPAIRILDFTEKPGSIFPQDLTFLTCAFFLAPLLFGFIFFPPCFVTLYSDWRSGSLKLALLVLLSYRRWNFCSTQHLFRPLERPNAAMSVFARLPHSTILNSSLLLERLSQVVSASGVHFRS